MKTDIETLRRLALAAHELRSQHPPATLLPAIHRRLDQGTRPRHQMRWSWLGWAGLSTASAALVVALVVNSTLPATQTPATQVDADGFVRLVSADEWQRANAADTTWLINAEMPQARLAALGLPYDPARAGERVPAQLLMRSSGEVLAVRLNK
jgi:hypothetical protein